MRDWIPASALEYLNDAVALLVAVEVSQRDTQVREHDESETFQRRAIGRNEQVHRIRSGEQADPLESDIEGSASLHLGTAATPPGSCCSLHLPVATPERLLTSGYLIFRYN